jgi:hypothetical protein
MSFLHYNPININLLYSIFLFFAMRALNVKESGKRRRISWQSVLVLVFIGIMLISTVAFSFFNLSGNGQKPAPNAVTYRAYTFKSLNGFWTTSYAGAQLAFVYLPEELELHQTSLQRINSYQGAPLYIIDETNSSDAEQEIARNLQPFVQRVQRACLEGGTCSDSSLPLKTCNDRIIIVRNARNATIEQEQNCLIIQGEKDPLLKLVDEALYKILGIIQ